ncbi:MmcQ/YjbR family DNA-binding protein [Paludibacter sp. 221]|uniref:MmcQ/YjbR family DNA-binding protein n=1 Tax=Paludibacter sp. 221 TaxID=2302939 RepID=UPI0013D0D3E3|nr:MmcQ/YjbR family DNA-binding protein [Paludibacter sp. 221]NDV46756.1 MmcQ/YjbR family DNA-binding protein [Paludibacter sp. 221]
MNKEELREYCISLKGVTEHFPFDDVSLVFKVGGKMFALLPLDAIETSIALKCDPDRAIDLREQYDAVRPAYHFNKKHWNSVVSDTSISPAFMKELISHSYELVVAGLPKKVRAELFS